MSKYVDRVLETSISTGTGNFTLAGAVAGYQSFSAAIDLNTKTDYAIVAVDASGVPTGQWEVGEGSISGATTLVRDVPLTGSGALPVNFSAGTKRVFITVSAEEVLGRGKVIAYAQGLNMP